MRIAIEQNNIQIHHLTKNDKTILGGGGMASGYDVLKPILEQSPGKQYFCLPMEYL